MKKLLPLLVFLLVAGLGLSMTAVVYRAEINAEQKRFEVAATEAVENIKQRLNQHVAILMSTRSLMRANKGLVNGEAFQRFVAGLDIENMHAGVQGIGYAQYINSGSEFIAEFRLKDNYGVEINVWPETEQTKRAAIVLLEPENARNHAALGYDMFSEEIRRVAMVSAIQTGELRATAPVELVQEITAEKQAGFLLYLPFGRSDTENLTDNAIEGFVYAPFRAGDLHFSAIDAAKKQPVALRSTDGDTELYRSADFDPANADYGVIKQLEIGGRTWDVELHETQNFYHGFPHLSSLVLGALSGVLAFALAVATVAQQNAIRQAHEVKRVVEDALKEKDMLLQEMRHRIKNSIARVLAIARQTGANSDNLTQFQESFNARLHAMANSQDLLTRNKWARADLHELLSQELKQVFGAELENCTLNGDKVELSETITQAVGLAAHEMATNALKYGGVADPGGRLDVTWEVFGKRKTRTLRLFWEESSPTALKPTDKKGFGTRLIDANITGELGGTIIRRFEDNGLHAEIVIPLGKS